MGCGLLVVGCGLLVDVGCWIQEPLPARRSCRSEGWGRPRRAVSAVVRRPRRGTSRTAQQTGYFSPLNLNRNPNLNPMGQQVPNCYDYVQILKLTNRRNCFRGA